MSEELLFKSSQKSRPYKIDVYGMQDNYLGTLHSYDDSFIGQTIEGKIELSTDGTQTFSCSIPKFYIDQKTNEKILNPRWIDINNGVLAENTRILKVFIDYGNEIKVYPFIVDKITDKRDSHFSVYKEIEASGLAFAELGKVGYKLELTKDIVLLEMEKDPEAEIHTTINYWLDKVFPNIKDENGKIIKWLSPWSYEIRMDWSEYSESDREPNKVYRDSYVSSWGINANETALEPKEYTIGKEKEALIDCINSNKYNITQSIAEAFGVFCSYEYKCDQKGGFIREYVDENGNVWQGRKVVFYNRAIKKDNPFYIEYQKNSDTIQRISDSSEIYTKLYVPNIQSSVNSSGLVSIADTPINPLMDDFILNFDYLYNIGSISDYQMNFIENYKKDLRKINEELVGISQEEMSKREQINELESEIAAAKNKIQGAQETLEEYQNLANAAINKEVHKGAASSYSVYFLKDKEERIVADINLEGVKLSKDRPIKLYSDYSYSTEIVTLTESESDFTNFIVELNSYGFPVRIIADKSKIEENTIVYLDLYYQPANEYRAICDTFMQVLLRETELQTSKENALKEEQELYKDIIEKQDSELSKKDSLNQNLEMYLGAALREGYWTPEEGYEDPGEKKSKEGKVSFDTTPFDGEELAYYLEDPTNLEEKTYYDYILLSDNDISRMDTNNFESIVIYLTEKKNPESSILEEYILYPNAGFTFGFFKINDKDTPIVLLNGKEQSHKDYNKIQFAFFESETADTSIRYNFENGISENSNKYDLIYPRIIVKEENIDYNSETQQLSNSSSEIILEKYKDYNILLRDGKPHYTLKLNNQTNFTDILDSDFKLIYRVSRANEKLYLDAMEVALENSRPRYSYEVEVVILPNTNLELGQLVYINDYSLGVHAATGYIDTLTLALGEGQYEDEITIKNYKTKFEDLFSTITASSEAMKSNQHSYNIAAGSFNGDGTLNGTVLQNTINSNNISFNYSNTNVSIDDKDGIVLTNSTPYLNGVYGQVVLRGGGIFLSKDVDDNGNRIWNTGITPSGINTSLLRAGQIDTNLIRIFAGENIAFQWNEEGIFAYKRGTEGTPDASTYVKYSDSGLQFIDNNHIEVDLGWNGLLISTQEGATELTGEDGLTVYYGEKNDINNNYAIRIGRFIEKGESDEKTSYGMRLRDIEGNDTLVTKTDGTLWLKHSLTVGSEDGIAGISGEGITSYDDEGNILNSPIRFWAGKTLEEATFYVREDGTLKATEADITGTITATVGEIGSWIIGDDGLYSSNKLIGLATNYNSNDPCIYVGQVSENNNSYFIVNGKGQLQAKDANISGEISAVSGNIGGWKIENNGLVHLDEEEKGVKLYSTPIGEEYFNIQDTFIIKGDGTAVVKGEINAGSGSIGDWSIIDGVLYHEDKNEDGSIEKNITLSAKDGINVNDSFTVNNAGELTALKAILKGDITAESGYISNKFYIGKPDSGRIILSSENDKPYISSSTSASGVMGAGWKIEYNGHAEFNDVVVRGKISSAVFEHNHISSIGGSLYIAPTIYTEVSSEKITKDLENQPEKYIIVWKIAGFKKDNYAGRPWANGDMVKLDGVLTKGVNDSLTISDITGYINYGNTEDNNLRIEILISDISEDLTGYNFNPGTAIIYYGTSTSKQGLFLTAVGTNAPYLEIYDETGEVESVPAAILGNLSGIEDELFGKLKGFGLYSSKAYLRGELRLPGAGITHQTDYKKNKSDIRIWAGLDKTNQNIEDAHFIVTEDGSLYATKGVFEGTVIAENSEFSGAIKTAGIIIDYPSTENENEDDGVSDHFYVAYKDNPTFEDYILNIDSTGLSIWEGGLQAYSDWASIIKEDNTSRQPIYSYQDDGESLPYFYLVDSGINTNVLTSRLVSNKAHFISFILDNEKNKHAYSTIIDNGIWFSYQSNFTYPNCKDQEISIFNSNDKMNGIYYNENSLNIKGAKGVSVITDNGATFNLNNKIHLSTIDNKASLRFDTCIIKEVLNKENKAIGLDFIASE